MVVVPLPVASVCGVEVCVPCAVLLGVEGRRAAPALRHAVFLEVAEGRRLAAAVGGCDVGVAGEIVGVVVHRGVVLVLRIIDILNDISY